MMQCLSTYFESCCRNNCTLEQLSQVSKIVSYKYKCP